MKKLLFIQPFFSYYRLAVIDELASHYDVYLITSKKNQSEGLGDPSIKNTSIKEHRVVVTKRIFGEKIFFQQDLIKITKEIKPDFVFICGAVRDVGFWILMFYCYFKNIPLYNHGQGPYNKQKGFLTWLEYTILINFSKRFVTYTPFSLKSFTTHGVGTSKVRVANNSLINDFPVEPTKKSYNNRGILFVGRFRDGSNLDLLIEVVLEIAKQYPDVICHIIGSGKLEKYYRHKYKDFNFIRWYGEVFEQRIISEVSKECIIGCYPGNTGLSVVHYMSLSLPVVVHDQIRYHQGPEPSYVIDEHNGKLFDFFNQKESLYNTLLILFRDIDKLKLLSQASYRTYLELSHPSYAQQIINIIEEK